MTLKWKIKNISSSDCLDGDKQTDLLKFLNSLPPKSAETAKIAIVVYTNSWYYQVIYRGNK